jgi:uncharacterized protein (DUF433 family)
VDARRAREFADLIDGDLGGFNYLAATASTGHGEEALKWIMGSLAAVLNERGLPFSKASSVLPPDYLAAFAHDLAEGRFEKSFAKDIFAELLAAPRFQMLFGTQWIVEDPDICGGRATYRGSRLVVADFSARLNGTMTLAEALDDWGYVLTPEKLSHGEAYLVARDEIGWESPARIDGPTAVYRVASNPRFKAADASAIDALIAEIVAANPDNAAKVADQPKLVQWFVGQVMKAVKAKGLPPMPAPTVLAKLQAHFGVSG